MVLVARYHEGHAVLCSPILQLITLEGYVSCIFNTRSSAHLDSVGQTKRWGFIPNDGRLHSYAAHDSGTVFLGKGLVI